jgi:hypothetical protein
MGGGSGAAALTAPSRTRERAAPRGTAFLAMQPTHFVRYDCQIGGNTDYDGYQNRPLDSFQPVCMSLGYVAPLPKPVYNFSTMSIK